MLFLMFSVVINLFAQQQQDSIVVKQINSIKNTVQQQQQEIGALTKQINKQRNEAKRQNHSIRTLETKNKSLNASIDSLNKLVEANSLNIETNAKELSTKINESTQKTDAQIAQLDSSLEKNRLYWIIFTLVTLLLGILIYWLLNKRILSNKTDVETQIKNTKAALEEESVKLDNKLVEILETQLKLKQEEINTKPIVSTEEVDHSLALKVADEIIRIQKNLSRMDESTKGLKQLNSSVKRIQDNFAANGYELVEMLGKEFNEGMKATVNFVQDENYEPEKRIITRIIKPQVNFKGVMIQTAQIEVTEA